LTDAAPTPAEQLATAPRADADIDPIPAAMQRKRLAEFGVLW
jgi:hypothetical protein